MLKLKGSLDYYPTPDTLLDRITVDLDWDKVNYVLEPSAGKGNIAEYLNRHLEKRPYRYVGGKRGLDIDCVEIEPELRSILIGKEFRVIHDDFLTLHYSVESIDGERHRVGIDVIERHTEVGAL